MITGMGVSRVNRTVGSAASPVVKCARRDTSTAMVVPMSNINPDPFTTRPEIEGTFGVVTSTHWIATAVGMGYSRKRRQRL